MSKLCLVLAVLLAQTDLAHAQEKSKLAVLDIQATGVEPDLVPTLTEILTVEIDAIGKYKVIAGRDVQSMLGFEKQKDIMGCTDASCLAEIGGALGVERIVAGHIGKVGSTYVINIKLINIRQADTENRVYETVRGEVDALIDAVRNSARKLLAGAGNPTAPTAKVEAPPPPVAAPPTAPSPRTAAPAPVASVPKAPIAPPPVAVSQASGARIGWAPITLWSVAGAALIVGAGMGIHAKSLESKANSVQPASNTGTVYDFGSQAAATDARSAAKLANVFYAVGIVSLAGGFLTWYLTKPEAVSTALAPTLSPDQIGLAIVGQF
jgi:hypothetical protein